MKLLILIFLISLNAFSIPHQLRPVDDDEMPLYQRLQYINLGTQYKVCIDGRFRGLYHILNRMSVSTPVNPDILNALKTQELMINYCQRLPAGESVRPDNFLFYILTLREQLKDSLPPSAVPW